LPVALAPAHQSKPDGPEENKGLPRWPPETAPSEHMEMDVKNCLARRRAYIGHNSIARLGNSFELRNGSANLEQCSKAFNVMVLEIFE